MTSDFSQEVVLRREFLPDQWLQFCQGRVRDAILFEVLQGRFAEAGQVGILCCVRVRDAILLELLLGRVVEGGEAGILCFREKVANHQPAEEEEQ